LTSAPPICVTLPTRNRRALALRLLESVLDQLAPGDELLVVDNASTDDTAGATAELLQHRWPAGRVVSEPRRGLSHARNRALHEAVSPVVAFLDDDEAADPNWLASLRRAWADAGPRVAGIGGPMRPDWQAPRPPWLADYLLHVISVLDLGPERKLLDQRPGTGYLWGGNLSVRRAAALEVGGFRPDDVYLAGIADPTVRARLPLSTARSGEEQNLQDRLAESGWEIWYEPAAAIDHLVPPTRLSERFFLDYHRQQAVLALGRGRSRAPALRILVRESARYALYRLRRDPRATAATFPLAGAWTLATGQAPSGRQRASDAALLRGSAQRS
jgi:glycosyltransferase involved in cell wall biosynthesis